MTPCGQLHCDQHFGIKPKTVGQAPVSGFAVPHCKMNWQRQYKPVELCACFERRHTIERMHAAQLEHEVEQRILYPTAYCLRRRRGVVAQRFTARVERDRRADRGLDSDRGLTGVSGVARSAREAPPIRQRSIQRGSVITTVAVIEPSRLPLL